MSSIHVVPPRSRSQKIKYYVEIFNNKQIIPYTNYPSIIKSDSDPIPLVSVLGITKKNAIDIIEAFSKKKQFHVKVTTSDQFLVNPNDHLHFLDTTQGGFYCAIIETEEQTNYMRIFIDKTKTTHDVEEKSKPHESYSKILNVLKRIIKQKMS
jgi:hypothetical protein